MTLNASLKSRIRRLEQRKAKDAELGIGDLLRRAREWAAERREALTPEAFEAENVERWRKTAETISPELRARIRQQVADMTPDQQGARIAVLLGKCTPAEVEFSARLAYLRLWRRGIKV